MNGSALLDGTRWRTGIIALWCAFAAQVVFVAVFLPPWQNPDEDGVAVIRTLARQSSIDLTHRRDRAVEAEVLASMAEHGWWAAYEEPVPDPLPTSFAALPAHIGDASSAPPLYFVLMSRYLRLVGAKTLLGQYYALRAASLLVSLLNFWLIMKAAREWFDESVAFCTGALVALLPQFALLAVTTTADPLVFLASTFVWWQAARVFSGRAELSALAMMVGVTFLAVFLKRIAVPLIIQTGVLSMLAVFSVSRRRPLLAITTAGMLAVAAAAALAAGKLMARPNELAEEPITGPGVMLAMVKRYWEAVGSTGPFSLEYFSRFTWRLFESAYLVAGWMRFHAPATVVALALLVMLIALVRGLRVSLASGDRRVRRAAIVAILFAAVQLAAVYGTENYQIGAQGRLLFPAIGPLMALAGIGLVRWDSPATRAAVCSVAIGVLAVLDLISWSTTVIPAYGR